VVAQLAHRPNHGHQWLHRRWCSVETRPTGGVLRASTDRSRSWVIPDLDPGGNVPGLEGNPSSACRCACWL